MNAFHSPIQQVAALPWRRQDGQLLILMITSRETRRWVIPKGNLMPDRADADAAAQEALEEAGVIGAVATHPIGAFRYMKRLADGREQPSLVKVYPLEVFIQVGDWPERSQREREWMFQADAADAVAEPELSTLILKFTAVAE